MSSSTYAGFGNNLIAISGCLTSAVGMYYATTHGILWLQVVLILSWGICCLLTCRNERKLREMDDQSLRNEIELRRQAQDRLDRISNGSLAGIFRVVQEYSYIQTYTHIEQKVHFISRLILIASQCPIDFSVRKLQSHGDTIVAICTQPVPLAQYLRLQDPFILVHIAESGAESTIAGAYLHQIPKTPHDGLFFRLDQVKNQQVIDQLRILAETIDPRLSEGYHIRSAFDLSVFQQFNLEVVKDALRTLKA
jgi:hypothetical protein